MTAALAVAWRPARLPAGRVAAAADEIVARALTRDRRRADARCVRPLAILVGASFWPLSPPPTAGEGPPSSTRAMNSNTLNVAVGLWPLLRLSVAGLAQATSAGRPVDRSLRGRPPPGPLLRRGLGCWPGCVVVAGYAEFAIAPVIR